jgi:hypothetical protein
MTGGLNMRNKITIKMMKSRKEERREGRDAGVKE